MKHARKKAYRTNVDSFIDFSRKAHKTWLAHIQNIVRHSWIYHTRGSYTHHTTTHTRRSYRRRR